MKSRRQRRGAWAESVAAERLVGLGWSLIARNVTVGRDEIDLLCVDPGPPAELVFVEVRSLRVAAFGAPEERVDGRKVARLYRSMAALLRAGGELADGTNLPQLPARVDLLVIDRRGKLQVRHMRRLMPP